MPEAPPKADQASLAAAASDWSYAGANGPEQWAKLKPEWSGCAAVGQSPIDLPLAALTPEKKPAAPAPAAGAPAPPKDPLAGLKVALNFAPLALQATSDGQQLRLDGDGVQGLLIDGRQAPLVAVDLHAPAEHKLGGVSPSLELVLWLKDTKLGSVALSVLFRSGAENAALAPLITNLPPLSVYHRKPLKAELALPALVPAGATLFAYSGTLSAPPCTAGVTRLVLASMLELSPAQLAALAKAVPSGARPVQPLTDRVVTTVTLQPSPTPAPPAGASAVKKP
ncbi:MAG TPA: carbonic anhydrase family protein [Polyangiaceae bacterium]